MAQSGTQSGRLARFVAHSGNVTFPVAHLGKPSEYASSIDSKIILIDGELLAQSMIEDNVGVTPGRIYEIKKLDPDYFTEE